jgi:hypothetical protein
MLFFAVSLFVIPMTPEHGYYTAFAKFMAQGMVPYKDFFTMEMPVGIGLYSILYRILGVEASSNFSLIPFFVINLVNLLLMWMLMTRLSIKKGMAFIGLLFYFLLCYSSDGLHVNMEILASTLLLGAFLSVLKRKGVYTMLATFLFCLAVGCKAQVIVIFPVLLMAAIKSKSNKFDFKQAALLVAGSALILFVGYIIVAYSCGNPEWLENIKWEIEKAPDTEATEMKSIVSYLVIQSVRCGVVFLLLAPFLHKKLHAHGRRMTLVATVATVCCFGLLFFNVEVVQGLLLYPFITIALMHIVQAVSRYWIAAILAVLMLTPPAALSVREWMKFGDGELKRLQNEEMGYIKESLKRDGKAVMLIDTDKEFYIGPQIFSECPHVKPVYIGKGSLGYKNGYYENEFFMANIGNADYIIINEAAFTGLAIGKYADAFGEKIEKMKSSGTQSIMIYEK